MTSALEIEIYRLAASGTAASWLAYICRVLVGRDVKPEKVLSRSSVRHLELWMHPESQTLHCRYLLSYEP